MVSMLIWTRLDVPARGIVQLVGDAGGELADGGKAFGLDQLALGPVLFLHRPLAGVEDVLGETPVDHDEGNSEGAGQVLV